MNTAFKTMGFQVVEADWNDMGPKIASGSVAAIYQNPAAVAAMQLHTSGLKNMMSVPVAPAMGGIVINKVTWNKISPQHQREIVRITRNTAVTFDAAMPQTSASAVATMSRSGLKVNRPTRAQEDMWYNEMQKVVPMLLGTTFDRDVYQKMGEVLAKYRAGR
jgi:TRAP-type C4-dicarboxylate transport system substrate-binding protein